MDKNQVRQVMMYCFVERGVTITEDRFVVWYDQLKNIKFEDGLLAARVLVARLPHAPTVHDFLKAVAEVTTPPSERIAWGQAWDVWRGIANKYGYYNRGEAIVEYEKVCPLGASALGSSANEFFTLETKDLGTFKAQFRQRFEAIQSRRNQMRVLPPEISKALGYDEKDGFISSKLVDALQTGRFIENDTRDDGS